MIRLTIGSIALPTVVPSSHAGIIIGKRSRCGQWIPRTNTSLLNRTFHWKTITMSTLIYDVQPRRQLIEKSTSAPEEPSTVIARRMPTSRFYVTTLHCFFFGEGWGVGRWFGKCSSTLQLRSKFRRNEGNGFTNKGQIDCLRKVIMRQIRPVHHFQIFIDVRYQYLDICRLNYIPFPFLTPFSPGIASLSLLLSILLWNQFIPTTKSVGNCYLYEKNEKFRWCELCWAFDSRKSEILI